MRFSIKDFSSKYDQNPRKPADELFERVWPFCGRVKKGLRNASFSKSFSRTYKMNDLYFLSEVLTRKCLACLDLQLYQERNSETGVFL